jgi:endonuclease I
MYSDIPGGTPAYTYTITIHQCGTYSGEGDCYNREHSFPKSRWGGFDDAANPQYTDLNHLYATDGYVNSKRSNYPFGEVSLPTYTSTNGSKVGDNTYSVDYNGIVFEPIDEYKGDFARTYLYMATRFKDEIPTWVSTYSSATDIEIVFNSTGDFTSWYINMLLDWHEADPVSQKELDRNQEVYNAQGNANPYIDHPEWACEVFASGSCTGVAAPQNFAANALSGTEILLNWNLNINANNIILAFNSSNSFGTPLNGTAYSANDLISGGGTILYAGNATSFNHTSLTEGTVYYYRVWSVDASSN